jgi:hypothetical protein
VVAGGGEGREVADLLWGEEEAGATTLFIERERRALIGGEEVPRIDTSERCAPWMLLWMDGCDAVLTRIDDVAKTRAGGGGGEIGSGARGVVVGQWSHWS